MKTDLQGNAEKQTDAGEFNTRSILTIIGSALSAFCTVGFLNAFGVLLDWYHRHELSDHSEFDISWIGSFTTFALFLTAIPAGLLADRVRPTILLIVGGIVTLFSMFMISLSKEYYQFFLAQGFLLGVGHAFFTFPVITVVSLHFNKNRGLATGFTISGSSLGGVIWPIVLDQLLNSDGVGFSWTIRIVTFTMLPLVVISCATVLPPAKNKATNEEGASTTAGEKDQTKKKTDLSIIKNPVFITFCTGLGIYYLGMFTPFFFVTSYAVSIDMSTGFAFYLVSILNGASLFGRISAGFFADRYGYFNLCSLAALASALITFCWTGADSSAGLVVWSSAYGFASGSILSLQVACATKLATPQTYGTAVGMTMGIVSLTGLFGSPISGELIKYSYLALSMYAGAVLAVGGILICFTRLQLSRKLLHIV
ncbi:uncharacterized protein Z518_02307 [Rhinocladiella mackenziei CBS 650.93]|uniref:Major facilitator superfamily (MFS) profile domain-containing protein n=1 Tax=Rhinocladiella mackenziei CBS 650.93 TaxID=1442369 RepID=A0A0D2IP70_9EURO|nr:uncharacterized protein Z518_02307 [Rhinocladiella mackenziei CBS 650.93]KIX07654.1 hypothetical protein Z518_02307 [Rhinocladiella mackenziei CBS 650.93]